MRRVIKIAVGVILCLIIVIIVGGLIFVESNRFDSLVRNEIKSYLERRFEMRVSLDRVDVRLLTSEFEIWNFKIYSLAEPRQPAIHIDQIRLNYTLTRLFKPAISLDRLYLKSPRVRMIMEPNRRINLANIFTERVKKPGGKPFSITRLGIRRLDMVDGLVLFDDHPVHVETAEGGLDAEWRLEEKPDPHYSGTVSLSALDIAISDFRMDQSTGKIAFQLYDNAVRVPSADIDSEQINVKAKGGLTDLRGKVYRFETVVDANVPKIQHPNLGPFFQEGRAQATGVFTGTGGDFVWEGHVQSPFMVFEEFPLNRFEAAIRMNKDEVQVQRMRANLYTGLVLSHGVLKFSPEERSEFQVEATGISLRPQLVQLHLQQVGVEGAGDFSGTVGWPGIHFTQITGGGRAFYRGQFTGFFAAERKAAASQPAPVPSPPVPLQGNSRVSFGNEMVSLRDGTIGLPASTIQYSGQISFKGVYDIDFTGQSQHAVELLRVAQMMGVTPNEVIEKYQIDPRGPASFTARLYQEAREPHVTAELKAQDVYARNEALGNLEAGLRAAPGVVEFDNVRLTAPEFRGTLTARLRTGETSKELNSVDLALENVPIARFLPFYKAGLPVDGIASGKVNFHETAPNRYQGGGQVVVRNGEIYDESVGPVSARIDFEGNQVLLDEVHASAAGGTISGKAAINLDTQVARLDVRGAGLDLQSVQAVRARTKAEGVVSFSIEGEGSVKAPNFHVQATAPTIAVKEYTFEQVQLAGDLKGRKATFRLQNVFRGKPFDITGDVGLDEPYPLNAAVDLDQLAIEPYLALLGEELPKLTGTINGRMQVHGPLQTPDRLVGQADLSLLRLKVESYEVQNTEPMKIGYTSGVLHIPSVAFRGPQTDFRVEGDITLKDRRPIAVKADGTVNLALLAGFMAEGTAGGQLQLNGVVTGTLDKPRIVGTAALRQGSIAHPSLPTSFYSAEGQFKFTANQVSIDSFTARTSYGVVSAEGGVFLEGFRPTRWQVNVTGSGLRVEYPAHVVSIVDVDLDALKSERSSLLSGAVYIRSAEYSQNISVPELILALTAPAPEKIRAAGTGRQQTEMNISVEAYQSIRVNNNLADITGSGDFNIRGTIDNPVILGSFTIDEGKLNLENNNFEISRGTVSFDNPRRNHANLNFEATTEKLDNVITIGVQGPIEHLNMTVRSEPPLPTATIVGLLALNQTQEESILSTTTQRPIGSVAGSLLLKGGLEPVEARATRLFGFEKFSIDPFFSAGSRDPSARVTLGKQLSRDLTVTYQTVLGNPQQEQFVSVEYRLTNWLTAIGTREENGSLAIDFKFRKRF